MKKGIIKTLFFIVMILLAVVLGKAIGGAVTGIQLSLLAGDCGKVRRFHRDHRPFGSSGYIRHDDQHQRGTGNSAADCNFCIHQNSKIRIGIDHVVSCIFITQTQRTADKGRL